MFINNLLTLQRLGNKNAIRNIHLSRYFMHIRSLLLSILSVSATLGTWAQTEGSATYYDITSHYLKNAGFDTLFTYDRSATGNINNEINNVAYWNNKTHVTYNSAAVIEVGSSKTFNGVSVPASAFDGATVGGVLALSTGWADSLRYVQTIKLPAGTYRLTSAWYNGDSEKTAGKSLLGFVMKYSKKYSSLSSFPSQQWVADTVEFTITRAQQGDLTIGFAALGLPSPKGSAEYAKVSCDFVKIWRTTPYGKDDADMQKSELNTLIKTATKLYGTGDGVDADKLKAVIDEATALCNDSDATREDAMVMEEKLNAAILAYHYANPTGKTPTITTNKRMARGATMAFGRMTLVSNGATITERGFCYGTNPNPTINDNRTSETIKPSSVVIYVIDSLQPSTRYYMRPYAITSGYRVVYGDVQKFYTLPKGTITYSVRSGDDNTGARARILDATKDAVNYWNNLTSIKSFHVNVGYESGTPTADCSYGGWIRVGSRTSYQRTGTLLHEMLHGVGVGTCGFWYDNDNFRERRDGSNRSTGHWLGDRANDVVRFLDNSETEQLNGDYQHLWPYGVNGASEDNGSRDLYIANSLVCQALCEDGLPATSNINFAAPYYAFDQEDTIKYYIKSESESYGLYTSFLKENDDKTLNWTTMTTAEASLNDSAAWYVTFNPKTCYYTFTNVATKDQIAYTSGVFKAKANAATTESRLQLMRGRVDVVSGFEPRGYYLARPENVASPHCLGASANNKVSPLTFNYANTQSRLRWLILTEEEAQQLDAIHQATGIVKVVNDQTVEKRTSYDVFNLSGQCVRRNASSLKGLPSGIYIVNGKKMVVR